MQTIPLTDIFYRIQDKRDFVFLETKRFTKDEHKSYLFIDPISVISCSDPSGLRRSLDKVEGYLNKGFYAAGFLSYESGFCFEDAFGPRKGQDFPLLWFGIYEEPEVFDHKKIAFKDTGAAPGYSITGHRFNVDEERYARSVRKIKALIEEGRTYQVNYTLKLGFSFDGSIFDIYRGLRRKQSVSYSSIMRCGGNSVISFSPELFFRRNKNRISVRPMKGTAGRGRYLAEDRFNAIFLKDCPKNRSENIMIVDLLRNDLGKICKKGSVAAKDIFDVESYESLLQMVSTVEGVLRPGVSLYELFKSIFPSGSVTGAPKIETMRIISELEKEPRRIYTGAIGFLGPKKEAVFNVAIRTLLLDEVSKKGEMGIGSGVVYDSDQKNEYQECRLKSKFLTDKPEEFELIETMLWQPGKGIELLKLHMERLKESSAYFNFSFNEKYVKETLDEHCRGFSKNKNYRVRLLLGKDGETNITSQESKSMEAELLIAFSDLKTDPWDRCLFHKTTNRGVYDAAHRKAKEAGLFDIIFENDKGEITEGAISNIFIKKRGRFHTPPAACGLLNGVYRRYILKEKLFPVEEKILYKKDVEAADEIFLTNAVRGMVRVRLAKKQELVYA